MKAPRVLVATLAVAVLALTGCSISFSSGASTPANRSTAPSDPTDTAEPATPTSSPRAAASGLVRRIPATVRKTYLAAGYEGGDQRWQPRATAHGSAAHITITERRVPGCDTGPWPHLAVDRDTRDFASTVVRRHGLIIARQLTIYPDARTAARFPKQMQHLSFCTYDGRTPYAVEGGEYDTGRAYGLRDNHGGALFSWGAITTRGKSAVWVDVVTRDHNAVAFTRVMNPDDTSGDADPLNHRARHRGLVAEARHQATVSARMLDGLR